MRKCTGPCGKPREIWEFYTNRHGNPSGTCVFCARKKSNNYYHSTGKFKKNPPKNPVIIFKSPCFKEINRPCAIFQGYLFAGDVI